MKWAKNTVLVTGLVFLIICTVQAGWEWVSATPQGTTLQSVWAASDTDAMAVGRNGTAMVWDGWCWIVIPSGVSMDFESVTAIAPKTYAVLCSDQSLRTWDGTAWKTLPVPPGLVIRAIWSLGGNSFFCAGKDGAVFYWDGVDWTDLDPPVTDNLHGIWGSSPTDIWVVGDSGTAIHWSGTEWAVYNTGTIERLIGVGGSGPGDVYAVAELTYSLEIHHFDGSVWTPVDHSFEYYPGIVNYAGIRAASADDIRIALAIYDSSDPNNSPVSVCARFDGDRWHEPVIPMTGHVTGFNPWASGPVVAVGVGGEIERISNGSWVEDAHSIPMHPRDFNCYSTDSAVVLDSEGYPVVSKKLWNWNGMIWNELIIPGAGYAHDFYRVRAVSAREIYVFGHSGDIVMYNGDAWQELDSGSTDTVHDVDHSHTGTVLTVGEAGGISRIRNGVVESMSSGTSEDLHGIWIRDDEFQLAVGSNGTILRGDGSSWTALASGTSETLRTVHGNAAGTIMVAGSGNTLLRWDSGTWLPVPGPDAGEFAAYTDLYLTPDGDIFLIADGQAFRFHDSIWEDTGIATAVGFSGTPAGDVYLNCTEGPNPGIFRWESRPDTIGMELQIPHRIVAPGDLFWIRAYLQNHTGMTLTDIPVYVILDVMGTLYFWPQWQQYSPPDNPVTDFQLVNVEQGVTSLQILPPFTWPDIGGQSMLGLYLYGAMLSPDHTQILGRFSSLKWGF